MLRSYSFCSLFAIVLAFASLVVTHTSSAQDLADVIEKCERSVVRIEVKGKNGDSLGSGFIVESDGVICTNVHVLAGAQEATATFANGKSFEIEGTYYFDESRDICIAQLAGEDFPKVVVSRGVPRKGETVTALGAPRGLSFTATTGIVSALRSGEQLGEDRAGTWIQIDAALSPGNSGGPLINSKGRVIAMSTLASTGRSQNLNFGISAKDVRQAIATSKDHDLISLPDGVGELEAGEGDGESESIIANRPSIPSARVKEYVEQCREDYPRLHKQFLRKTVEAEREFREIRKSGGGAGFKSQKFRNAKKISDENKRLKSVLTKKVTSESLYELLKAAGPSVDVSRHQSFGTLDGAIVLHAFNDHDVIMMYESKPYLVWLPSTSGLSGGSKLRPTTVFVYGTQTVKVPGRTTMAVTVLAGLKESELKKAIFSGMKEKDPIVATQKTVEGSMRTWTAGKFTVIAKVVRVENDNVTLETIRGKTINVVRSKISDGDNEYLDSLD